MMDRTVFDARSMNGHRGLTILCPKEVDVSRPVEGRLKRMGTIDGAETYHLVPEHSGTWFLVLGDAEPIEGATTVTRQDLQGGRIVTLTALGEWAVVRTYGYKRRSERLMVWYAGAEVELPPPSWCKFGERGGWRGPGTEGCAVLRALRLCGMVEWRVGE